MRRAIVEVVAAIPQIDGGIRYVMCTPGRMAREAREELARDPAMIDHIECIGTVDACDGRLYRDCDVDWSEIKSALREWRSR